MYDYYVCDICVPVFVNRSSSFRHLYKWKTVAKVNRILITFSNFFQLCDSAGTILIDSNALAQTNHSKPGKLINDLMGCLYSVDDMATSTLYGQGRKKENVKALDQSKLDALRGKYKVLLFKMKITS